MNIGESLLTRFAAGGNKDLLCKYVEYLSPVQIVTDLRSDPEDPFQWEPGKMGIVHRQSWLEARHVVIQKIAECYKHDTVQITLLLRAASQLNYMDLIQLLLNIPVDKPFDAASGMKTWNVLYGPYKGTQYIADKDIESAILGLIQNSLKEPLELLLDMYGGRVKTRARNVLVEAAVSFGDAGVLRLLTSRLGKPKEGQKLLDVAMQKPEPEILRYLFENYALHLSDAMLQAIIERNSVPLYSAIPKYMHISYDAEANFAFKTHAYTILRLLRPYYHSFGWLMDSMNTGTSFRGASQESIKRTLSEIWLHPDFRYPRDVNVMELQPRAPRAGTYLHLMLRSVPLVNSLTKEQLHILYEKWKHRPKLGNAIQSILRARFQRLALEGEPPQKMLKDPMTPFYI
jgi:hypothetical protein